MRSKAFALLTLVFLMSVYYGYSIAKENPEFYKNYIEQFFSKFKFIKNYSSEMLVLVIFCNNAIKSLVFMLTGFFFGIAPLVFIAANGFLLGLVLAIKEQSMGIFNVLMLIVPHGILEIPAVLLASSQGVVLGYRFYEALFKGKEFRVYVIDSIKFYLKFVLPILLIAAFVEVYVTPYIASLIFGISKQIP